jgi:hypothetical protein
VEGKVGWQIGPGVRLLQGSAALIDNLKRKKPSLPGDSAKIEMFYCNYMHLSIVISSGPS